MTWRVVFDTNVVVSALVFGSRLAWLRAAWRSDTQPVICCETSADLRRVLAYPKFKLSATDQVALLNDYLPFAVDFTLPDLRPELPVACRDRTDAVFLQLALCAGVPLVSSDKDVTVLRGTLPIPIRTASAFALARQRLAVDQLAGIGWGNEPDTEQ